MSILDDADPQEADAEAADVEATEAPAWQWAEEVPGAGDAPDWFKSEKYATVAEQAKAYRELESQFGDFTGAPEEYTRDGWVPEEVAQAYADNADMQAFVVEEDDPFLELFVPLLKDANMSESGVAKMAQAYYKLRHDTFVEGQASVQEAIQAMGANAPKRLANVDTYLRANLDDVHYQGLRNVLTDADSFQAIEMLIGKIKQPRTAPTDDPKPSMTLSEVNELWSAMTEDGKRRRVDADPDYRAHVRSLRSKVVGEGPAIIISGEQ
tara:strand:- start:2583 stop:3383 length:801 start_codon:yes stop_codon:yes gene_type:complete